MTCVLSMSLLYQNQYKDNATDLQNKAFKYLDFNWNVNGCQHSGILRKQTHCSKCHIDTDKGSSKMCQLEISNEILENVKYVQHIVPSQIMYGSKYNTQIINENDLTRTSDMCIRSDNELGKFEFTKIGVKRKADTEHCVEEYIPPKRVSPFLNTPKEKKDERKNVLNISMKKKELDDPEIFLRRSVLINNLTECLQTE
ncbi:uncharacterized protein LOC132715626 [Ruditapes philippinarum]|uniref:uncharacterized protein LOC132715626 n=1 Tax=Ruditapes philippinarum TaxID=129788 RepID=UPI00295BD1B1|nr:uncharacterized protein LOC132715626 [Ruditapes philippinarum]